MIDDFMNEKGGLSLELLLCAKCVYAEAKGMTFSENDFKLLGHESRADLWFESYHTKVDLVPRKLLSRIKHLELGNEDLFLTVAFDVYRTCTQLWNGVLQHFTALQTSRLPDVSPLGLIYFIDAMRMPYASYLNPETQVRLEIALIKTRECEWKFPEEDIGRRDLSRLSRFIVPPVRLIVIDSNMSLAGWRVMMDTNFYGAKVVVISESVMDSPWTNADSKDERKWMKMICEIRPVQDEQPGQGDAVHDQE